MKSKIICIALVMLVMFTVQPFNMNITNSPEYRLDVFEKQRLPILSQEEEFNISTYHDFAAATADIIVSKLVNLSTGLVFHAGNADWELFQLNSSTANYYWAISALANAYDDTGNETYKTAVSRAALKLVDLFLDPTYPGFYLNGYSAQEVRESKRAGAQAYAYWALDIAETVNDTLDFTAEKQSAITCLTDVLYDSVYGGFYFFTLRNGSLTIPEYIFEVYPNDGKRLDHIALGASALYDAGESEGNTTLTDIANEAMNFVYREMRYYYDFDFRGLRLAVYRNGTAIPVDGKTRPGHTVVTDVNAIAMRAFLMGYEIHGNTTYLDTVENVFGALLKDNWDPQYGGWFRETLNGVPYDPEDDVDVKYYKYAEDQFQMILAIEMFYETTLEQNSLHLIIDTLELVLTRLWENIAEGFVRNGNQEWQILDEPWATHYTSVQSQAVLALNTMWGYNLPIVSNVRIQPISPRPHDSIDFIATALDQDGISKVYVNYTTDINGTLNNELLVLEEHAIASGVYNNSIPALPDQTTCNFLVIANDTTGREFIAGSYFFIVRADIYAPVVTLSAVYPADEVRVGDNVVIYFSIYEFPTHSYVVNCEMHWRVNSGIAFTITNMSYVGVDGENLIFGLDMGQFNMGDDLEFECHVEDEAGNIGVSLRHVLTVIGPQVYISPLVAWQMVAAVGLLGAPGIGYAYARRKKETYRKAQREGKKDAKRRARKRGSSRSRRQT